MKDFYTQCLKDLFAFTGIEQVRWMLLDLKDGERNFDLCVEGMVQVSKLHDYISEEEQKRIVRRMMVEDKDYTNLNARTVYRWLSNAKDAHTLRDPHDHDTPPDYQKYLGWCHAEGLEPLPEDQYTKQPSDEQVNLYAEKLKASLAQIGRVTSPQPFEEKGYEKSVLPEYLKEHIFTIEGIDICAQTEESARKIYDQAVADGRIVVTPSEPERQNNQ